jgi:hypothetical protein
MGEPHILTTLRCRREKIEAAIAAYEAKIETARSDLAALNRTMALFEPNPDAGPITPYFELGRLWRAGEIASVCLTVLERDGPLETARLADCVAAAKGLDATDERMRKLLIARVARALSNMLRRGKIRAEDQDRKGVKMWSARAE